MTSPPFVLEGRSVNAPAPKPNEVINRYVPPAPEGVAVTEQLVELVLKLEADPAASNAAPPAGVESVIRVKPPPAEKSKVTFEGNPRLASRQVFLGSVEPIT